MTVGDIVSATPVSEEGPLGVSGESAKKIEGRSPWRLAMERLRKDRAALISLIVIILIVAMAVFAPVVASVTGHGVNTQYRDNGLSVDGLPIAPNSTFWFGTDDLGRDVLVRVAYGARISLIVGVLATALTVSIGAAVGLAAAFFGGIVDTILARVIDIMLSLPFLLLAISLASVFQPSLTLVIVVLGIFGWSSVARIVRGQVLSIREREYIEAARSIGAGSGRIMLIDILPNVLAPIIVYTTLLIPVSIVGEATLSFLAVGVQPPTADWGQMIAEASGIYFQAPWFLIFPSLALLLTTLAFNIFGDGVRDAFDPRGDRLFA